MLLTCVSRTVPGTPTRNNEDAWLALPEVGLFAVADGMGGHHHGALASREALRLLEAELNRTVITAQGIRRAILSAHARLRACRYGGELLGTTIVVAWIASGHIHCFHLGDSRAYRFRDYFLERITVDHSGTHDDLGNRGVVWRPERAVGKALGMNGDVLIETSSLDWQSGDRLLLVTDGISDVLRDLDISNTLAVCERSPAEVVESLVGGSEAAGGRDDKTALLVFERTF